MHVIIFNFGAVTRGRAIKCFRFNGRRIRSEEKVSLLALSPLKCVILLFLCTPILRLPGRSENIYRTFNWRSKTSGDIKRESLAVQQEIKYGRYCLKDNFVYATVALLYSAFPARGRASKCGSTDSQLLLNPYRISTCNYSPDFLFRLQKQFITTRYINPLCFLPSACAKIRFKRLYLFFPIRYEHIHFNFAARYCALVPF